VIVRQQYTLDVDTGKWSKSDGASKLAELEQKSFLLTPLLGFTHYGSRSRDER
jgi:hypothetical protein